jgi:hypothetical protein
MGYAKYLIMPFRSHELHRCPVIQIRPGPILKHQ